jgi:molybdopterin synthase catalytic subunit
MPNAVCEVLVTSDPLERLPDEEMDGASGAVVEFFGVVRQMENGRQIDGIEYEAHTVMAEYQLKQIAEAAAEKFSLQSVCIHHRIGFVRAGESSLFLQVRAAHRGPAFNASQSIVDELKKKVPIWKKPRFQSEEPVAAVAGRDRRFQQI